MLLPSLGLVAALAASYAYIKLSLATQVEERDEVADEVRGRKQLPEYAPPAGDMLGNRHIPVRYLVGGAGHAGRNAEGRIATRNEVDWGSIDGTALHKWNQAWWMRDPDQFGNAQVYQPNVTRPAHRRALAVGPMRNPRVNHERVKDWQGSSRSLALVAAGQ